MNKTTANRPEGVVRIIGGHWRGRKLTFPQQTAIRPTPDRVRETVFNWLQGWVHDARCLDLYAGSGILGLEALSRGARSVTLVDEDIRVVQQLQRCCEQLDTRDARVEWTAADDFLLKNDGIRYDIVFLDPPYRDRRLTQDCERLERYGLLSDEAWIYLEDATAHDRPEIPDNWSYYREKTAGQVCYRLAKRGSGTQDRQSPV